MAAVAAKPQPMLGESIPRTVAMQLGKSQACHRCRRRKMKWFDTDAQRPVCGTCIRSHRYAKNRLKNPTQFSGPPECTYDEVLTTPFLPEVEATTPSADSVDLEAVVESLEAEIQSQDEGIARLLEGTSLTPPELAVSSPAVLSNLVRSTENRITTQNSSREPSYGGGIIRRSSPFYVNDGSEPKKIRGALHSYMLEDDIFGLVDASTAGGSSSLAVDAYFFTWPSTLPPPDLLHHLVEIFFQSYPFANYILNRPAFETALSLPTSSPMFPQLGLLHAICAIASFHSHLVQPPETRTFEWDHAGDAGLDLTVDKVESFGEVQAFYADGAWAKYLATSKTGSLEMLISRILIASFYHYSGRFDRTWVSAGTAIRLSVSYKLHLDPKFRILQRSYDAIPPVISLPSTESPFEEEYRRNCFWLSYIIDRSVGPKLAWTRIPSDTHINQRLPTALPDIHLLADFSPNVIQNFLTEDLFVHHPPSQTDGFVLLAKASFLISQVREFSLRYSSKHEDVSSDAVRSDPSFQQLENSAKSFLASIPTGLQDPLKNGSINVPLLTALNMPLLAIILLHSPHADHANFLCPSLLQIQLSIRVILDILHPIINSSCDLTVIDPSCSTIWLLAGQEHSTAAIAYAKAGMLFEALTMRSEIDVFLAALSKVSERLPIGYRYFRELSDHVISHLDPLLQNSEGIALSRHPQDPLQTAGDSSVLHGLVTYGASDSSIDMQFRSGGGSNF